MKIGQAIADYAYDQPLCVQPAGAERHERASIASPKKRKLPLFGLFAIELVVLCLGHLPGSLTLDQFAFCDAGANLTVHYLIAHGLKPAVDFGFNYGLLGLLVSRVWFAIFGASPYAYQGMMLAANLVIAWALAEIAIDLSLGGVGVALLFVSLGIATQAIYPEASQAFEAALLAMALAQQAANRQAIALALCTAAVLVKPSMGFFYGLLLILLVLWKSWGERDRFRCLAYALAPAAITGLALVILLALIYGPVAVLKTALPLNAAVTYTKLHFGFFHGTGRDFWLAPGMPWMFYLFDVSGFWIFATIFLFAAAICSIPSAWKRTWSPRIEVILTCALLNAIFITLLFGNKWSWYYYSYVLVIGVAIAADSTLTGRRIGIGLCALTLFLWIGRAHMLAHLWTVWGTRAASAGLWAAPDEAAEWQHVRDIARGHDAVMLDTKGAAELIFTEFAPSVTLYLDPGWMLAGDIGRKTNQLERAQMVVVPYNIGLEVCRGVPDSPDLRASLNRFQPVYQGHYFEVLKR